VSSPIISSTSTKTVAILNSALGRSGAGSPSQTLERSADPSKKSSSLERRDRIEPSSSSEDKLINAANAYRDTAQLVNKLLATKDSSLNSFSAKNGEQGEINASAGSDFINSKGRARINAGAGNDIITASGGGQVNAGSGDDIITTRQNAQINGGSGDDLITSFGSYSQVNAGTGDDHITSYGFSQVNAGHGDDIVNAYGSGPVNGGAGDDKISSYGAFADVDAGSGDDTIVAGAFNTVEGGQGDDKINVVGSSVAFNFNKGDGQDEITTANNIDINLGQGLSFDDVNISEENGQTIVSFNGSDEKLTLNLRAGASANLTFADGKTLSA